MSHTKMLKQALQKVGYWPSPSDKPVWSQEDLLGDIEATVLELNHFYLQIAAWVLLTLVAMQDEGLESA